MSDTKGCKLTVTCEGGIFECQRYDLEQERDELLDTIREFKEMYDFHCNQANKLREALKDISELDPYPSTEKNIRRSHARHIEIAKAALLKDNE